MTTKFDIIKLKSQAALGNVEAMFILGFYYFYGIGVEVDLMKAHSYLHKSSQKGFVPARDFIELVFADKGESTELDPGTEKRVYQAFQRRAEDAEPAFRLWRIHRR